MVKQASLPAQDEGDRKEGADDKNAELHKRHFMINIILRIQLHQLSSWLCHQRSTLSQASDSVNNNQCYKLNFLESEFSVDLLLTLLILVLRRWAAGAW